MEKQMEKVVAFIKRAQAYAKFWVAFVGGIAEIVTANLDIPDEWQRWQRLKWSGALHAEDMPLMRPAGAYVPPDKARVSWATPQSLRNVDAECQVEITQLYMLEELEDTEDA